MARSFSVMATLHSMRHAFNGAGVLLKEEHNARVHLVATLVVIVLALVLGASRVDWMILTLAVTAVWVTEALNTCVENLCDLASEEFDPRIGKIKDIAAAAVLIASAGALICGLLVFLPLFFSA